MAVGPWASSKRATADSGTAAPEPVATLSDSSICRSPRARSSSCTRIGTCRSPTSNLARLAPMSPMVAMRTASEMASVETPSSAAMSVIGTTRSSGRSSSAVAPRHHQLELALAVVLQEPEADVGHAGEAAADLLLDLRLRELALGLRNQV